MKLIRERLGGGEVGDGIGADLLDRSLIGQRRHSLDFDFLLVQIKPFTCTLLILFLIPSALACQWIASERERKREN